jgi:hypothetical protein
VNGYLVLPVTKGPHPTGRVGPVERQDWFRGLVKATRLLRTLSPSKILVLSDVHVANEEHEADIYLAALRRLGVDESRLMVVRDARETSGQVEAAKAIARREDMELVVVTTALHYLRVRWLFRGFEATHHVVFGIPRPREAVTDLVLTFLFPLLDLAGGRAKFVEKVTERRLGGKH